MFNKCMLSIFLIVVVSLLLSSLVISAQDVGVDDQGNPNDPTLNERANACYTDPRLEGQCDTAAEWLCGYALIRYDYALIDRDEMIATGCGGYLPPEAGLFPDAPDVSVVPDANPTGPCTPTGTGVFVDAPDNTYRPDGEVFTIYADAACTQATDTWTGVGLGAVFTTEGHGKADNLCVANTGLPAILIKPSYGYFCY